MNSNQTRLVIGPSTGWLYARGIYSSTQQKAFLRMAGANSVEICLGGWESDDKRTVSIMRSKGFYVHHFPYCSLHIPDINDQDPEHQFAMALEFVVCCGANVALTHPLKIRGDYPTGCYERMISSGIPLAVENMDSRKDSGFRVEELERLVMITGCLFVLDVQHAYEHDPEMKYAGDLLQSLGDNLMHLHVSGEADGNIHTLVCRATNAARIVEFIGQVLSIRSVPLILEGEYTTPDELRQEIEFLRKELGFC